MPNQPTNCPHCNTSLLGEAIPEESRHYYGDSTHFKREIGIEIRGLYDGVWYYKCPDCNGEFGGAREWKEDPNCLVGRDKKNV